MIKRLCCKGIRYIYWVCISNPFKFQKNVDRLILLCISKMKVPQHSWHAPHCFNNKEDRRKKTSILLTVQFFKIQNSSKLQIMFQTGSDFFYKNNSISLTSIVTSQVVKWVSNRARLKKTSLTTSYSSRKYKGWCKESKTFVKSHLNSHFCVNWVFIRRCKSTTPHRPQGRISIELLPFRIGRMLREIRQWWIQ